jgi:hypothetical protein
MARPAGHIIEPETDYNPIVPDPIPFMLIAIVLGLIAGVLLGGHL